MQKIFLITISVVLMIGVLFFVLTRSTRSKTCQKSCEDKPCGSSDGCGGLCQGVCTTTNETCVNFMCIQKKCLPSCVGKKCGESDGCSDNCCSGTCEATGQVCVNGQCIGPCIPNCKDKPCGAPDGCGGFCSGVCDDPNFECINSQCQPIHVIPAQPIHPLPPTPVKPVFPPTPVKPVFPPTPVKPDFPPTPVKPVFPPTPVKPIFPPTPVKPIFPPTPVKPDFPPTPVKPVFPPTPVKPVFPPTPVKPVFPPTPVKPSPIFFAKPWSATETPTELLLNTYMKEGDLIKGTFGSIQVRFGIFNSKLVTFNGGIQAPEYVFSVSKLENVQYIFLQPDGNLVVFDPNFKVLWTSNTQNQSVEYLNVTLPSLDSLMMSNLVDSTGTIVKSFTPGWDMLSTTGLRGISSDVNPEDFGGKNKRVSGTAATFVTGDYVDIRNEQGFFASTFPTVDNPLGFRLQAMANTMCFYGFNTSILYVKTDPTSVGAYFIMRPQGDAVIVSTDGKILWSTGTTTGAVITFAEDGDVIVYNANSQPIWQQSNPAFASTAFRLIP